MNFPLDISYGQLLRMIRQLPIEKKIMMTKELEKETISKRFENLLRTLKTDEITLEEITAEVEMVRAKRYGSKK